MNKVHKHMPQLSGFEVHDLRVCHFPSCPSSHHEPVCLGRCDPKCHAGDSLIPGGPGMWFQCQVQAGGQLFNNASHLATVLAVVRLWSVPRTSVAGVFNHLVCCSSLPADTPRSHPSAKKSMKSAACMCSECNVSVFKMHYLYFQADSMRGTRDL